MQSRHSIIRGVIWRAFIANSYPIFSASRLNRITATLTEKLLAGGSLAFQRIVEVVGDEVDS